MANASIISGYNNSNVQKATTHIYICSKLEFSSLTYSCNFPRFRSGLWHLSTGPVTCEWILYLDCAVLPHEHLALPEPTGTPCAFSKTKEPLYLVYWMIPSLWLVNLALLMMKLTFPFCHPSSCLWSVWPRMSATCCRATYGSYLLESYWSWSFAVCVSSWGSCSSQT